jgi:hypothetical protein
MTEDFLAGSMGRGTAGLKDRDLATSAPQKNGGTSAQGPGSVSGPVLVQLGATLLGVLTVGNAYLLNAIVGAFNLLWLASMLILEMALIAGILIWKRSLRPTVCWNGLEIFGMLVVGAIFLVHAIYLAPSDLMPVSFSVDNAHQHLLTNYIYQNNKFPDGAEYLYIFDSYPVAPSALAALSSQLFGLLPAQTLYPLAALLVAAQMMMGYGVSVELLPRRPASYVLATLASFSIFLAYQYSVQVFAERFYANMIMGDLLVLLTLWLVTVRDKLHPLLSAGVGLILVFGCLNSYPAWLPFVIIPILASTLLDRSMSVRQRLVVAGVVGGITALLTIGAIVDQWDFITWFAPVRDRRLTPSWGSLGGVFVLLAAWGLVVLVQNWRRMVGFALFVAIDFALVAAFYAVALLDLLALYIPDKTFYANVFVLAVLVALSLNWFWKRLTLAAIGRSRASIKDGFEATASRIGASAPNRRTLLLGESQVAGSIMLVAGLAAVVLLNWRYPSPDLYPITLDEYRVAYQVSQEMPDEELVYLVRNHVTFYWIYGCVLNHTEDLSAQSERWESDTPTYHGWIQDSEAPRRAIVSDLRNLPQDGFWREVIRFGNSGLIEKGS